MTLYMHATLTPVAGRLADLGDAVARIKGGLEASGMSLRRAWRTPSDDPGTMVDLWELPDANTIIDALAAAAAHPRHEETMAWLATLLADERLRMLSGAPHHPQYRPGGGSRCLQVTYRVRYGSGPRTWGKLPAPAGWQLAGAFGTAFGDLCEIVELWEPPDGADAAALDGELPDTVRDRTILELDTLAWSIRGD
jgi:hypothetical protein